MVKNAGEAMADTEHPRQPVEISSGRRYAAISIRDNGPGISPENIAKLGTPFFTVTHRGSGLGLSMCYQTTDEPGGHIRVENQLGEGAAFHITSVASGGGSTSNCWEAFLLVQNRAVLLVT
jgi:C4-dicarboxylate-specific signal transduction histidine kinase